MQQIVRRLRPAPELAHGFKKPLPTYLLFAPGLGVEVRAPKPAPAPAKRPRRRRTSVLLFLEKVLCPT
jgi:hypothetical protein